MATNSKVFVSPGVYTSERDLSYVSQSIGVTTLGMVGETLRGPAFEPIFITNYTEFETFFGGTSPERFVNTQIPKYEAAYIAKAYLQQSNQLFVTRILGLSGYDAGPSWSIQTIANVDPYTVTFVQDCTTFPSGNTCITVCDPPTAQTYTLCFSGTANQIGTVEFLSNTMSQDMIDDLDTPYTAFDGSSSTIATDIKTQLLSIFANTTLSATSINYFGTIYETIADLLEPVYTDSTNVFGVDNINSRNMDFSSRLNDTWYYATFDNYTGNDYSGYSFYSIINNLEMLPKPVTTTTTAPTTTTTTPNPCVPGGGGGGNPTTTTTTIPDSFSGCVTGLYYNFTGFSWSNYNNLVVATLRSRGITTYNSSCHGPAYEVSNIANVSLDFSGSYSAVSKNPYATFGINIQNDAGTNFIFKTSMSSYNTNYLPKVFGTSNFMKPKSEVPLFVEEHYDSMLNYAFGQGYIRGLRVDLISLDSARSGQVDNLGYYLDKYQSPSTPWVVSELRGNVVYRLFKVVSIADGDSANTTIKVSFINMSFDNGTFDVIVRDYYDSDQSPVVLEKFSNCSMNPGLNNFIAKKIGTSNGDYTNLSKYIMVEMNEDAPAEALPCGFEGYQTRVYDSVKSPFPVLKTRYNKPGDVIYNPPFGNSNGIDDASRTNGDNVRRTYLGFSNAVDAAGWDSDFLQYKGVQNLGTVEGPATQKWNYMTQGFHMDSGSTSILIPNIYVTSGQSSFQCGDSEFRNDPTNQNNSYFRIYARKFTVMFEGGFDGWDVYRENRTNGNEFQLGKSGFLAGANKSFRFPNATGEGLLKIITVGDNLVDWANTDYYAYLLGQATFNNPASTNINVFVTPGIDYVTNEELVKQAINLVEYNRADSIYITTTPDWDMFVPVANNPADFVQAIDAIDNLATTDIDSNYTATYYPWILTRDSVTLTQIYIPPTAEVCRNLALTDNVAFPWFATAGYTRGLVNGVKARRKLTQEERDTLYIGRINPIATFADVGPVIWGNKTLQVAESALDRINVRRLLLQARKLISAVAIRLLFEQNDEKVRQDFLDAVNPILDAIRRDRGLYDFRVTVSNSVEDLDKNQLVGKIYIKPTKALEFIDIEFLITPTGASFENV